MNQQTGLAHGAVPRILPLDCNSTELNLLYYATGREMTDIMDIGVTEEKRKDKKK